MVERRPSVLTTGQAAKLCEVTPDTILKWIRRGRLRGSRTAGGHYRINREDLEPHIPPGRLETPVSEMPGCFPNKLRCWEYLSNKGVVRDSCKSCVVYRVGAARCFLMAGLEPDIGHAKRFCQSSCEDCVYYRRMTGLATNILVITSDEAAISRLAEEANESIAMRFARTAYDASAIIHDFRPAFAVVDEELLEGAGSGLLDSLAGDRRVPGLRVILAVAPSKSGRRKARPRNSLIVSVLEKPFSSGEIAEVIDSFPVDSLPVEEAEL
jgi:excisionase family DNA binding protein